MSTVTRCDSPLCDKTSDDTDGDKWYGVTLPREEVLREDGTRDHSKEWDQANKDLCSERCLVEFVTSLKDS